MAEADRYKVLHVEDDPAFAELTCDFLERVSQRIRIESVTECPHALEYLDTRPVDCIISDFDLPGMDGLDFLRRVRETDPDLPFILFTGKGSEEVASEAISAGVTDYLQKETGTDQFTVLANRIERAVDRHRAEQRLQEARERHSTLFQNQHDPIIQIVFDENTPVIDNVNRAARSVFDIDPSAVTGRPVEEVLVPDDATDHHQQIVEQVLDGEPVETEVKRLTPTGPKDFLLRVFPVEDFRGRRGSYAIYTDITDQKTTENRLQILQAALEQCKDSIYLTDRDGTIEYVNPAFERTTGYTADEAIGQTPRILKSGYHEPAFYDELWATITSGDVWHNRVVNRTKTGELYEVNQTIAPIVDDNEWIQHFVAVNAAVPTPETPSVASRYHAVSDMLTEPVLGNDQATR
mgnify:CR=1 FL=1